jgi:hypothetical protein
VSRASWNLKPAHRRRGLTRAVLLGLVMACCLARTVVAAAPSPTADDDSPSGKPTVLGAMQELRAKYGSDAVMLQGHLLSHSVRSGAVGETAVSVAGFEERDGKRFLTFRVETGIIYNDREPGDATRPARLWSDIVEASLRKFRTFEVAADGLVIRLAYAHRAYGDEAELRTHPRDQPGAEDTVVFFLLLPDVADMIGDRISGQQLVERSTVLLNGAPEHVLVAAPTPTAEATPHE